MPSNYDKFPFIEVSKSSDICFVGWDGVFQEITRFVQTINRSKCVICMDMYHGVEAAPVREAIRRHMGTAVAFHTNVALKSVEEIGTMVYPFVTDDQVFGKMNDLEMTDFFETDGLDRVRQQIRNIESGTVIVYGEGATLFADADLVVYVDLARWEIQKRMKRGIDGNFGMLSRCGPSFT